MMESHDERRTHDPDDSRGGGGKGGGPGTEAQALWKEQADARKAQDEPGRTQPTEPPAASRE